MDEKEYNNVYTIPANYTDSGRLLGGMLEVRNSIEAVFLVLLIGYPELMWLPFSPIVKMILMTVTLLPLAVIALIGIGGDSLMQYFFNMCKFWIRRRKLHFRRIGYRYENYNRGRKRRAHKSNGKKKREA